MPVGVKLGHHDAIDLVGGVEEIGRVVGTSPVVGPLGCQEGLLADVLDDAESKPKTVHLAAVDVHEEIANLVTAHRPNRGRTDQPDTIQFSFGQSETNYNQAEFNFKLQGGPGSASNFFALGLFGLPQIIKAIGTGAVQFPAIGTTASAANAFIDGGAANSLLRSTSSLKYKADIEPLDPQDGSVSQ